MVEISKKLLDSATRQSEWDVGNKVLYDLCEQYPNHKINSEIIAKVWLIGRAYAAAIERRRQNSNDAFEGDDFYTEKVAPEIRKSKIDEWFSLLHGIDHVNENNINQVLLVHLRITELFRKISGLEKRSLASKYLHFHFPNLFFIYDSRAVTAVSHLSAITGRVGRSDFEADNEYRKFCENA